MRSGAGGQRATVALLALAGTLGVAAWAGDAGRGCAWVARGDPAGPALQHRNWELGPGEWPGALGALGEKISGGALPSGVQLRVSHSAALPLHVSGRACLAAAAASPSKGPGSGGRELRDAEVTQHSPGECAGGLPKGVALRVELEVQSRSVETTAGRRGMGAAGGAWFAVRAVPTLGGMPLDVVPFVAAALAAVCCGLALAEVSAHLPRGTDQEGSGKVCLL